MTPLETELREAAETEIPETDLIDLLTRAADAVADDRALISSLADQLNKHVGRA